MAKQEAPFDGARLIRFAEALDASVEELRSLPPGSLAVEELRAIVLRTMSEAEAVIPSPLLRELHHLVGPMNEPETERDLRVMLVEIDGWVRGLLGSMGVTIAAAGAPEGEA